MRLGLLLVAGATLLVLGVAGRRPELAGLGAAALVLALAARAVVGSRRTPAVTVGRVPRRVTRGDEVTLSVRVAWPRGRPRWCSLLDHATGQRQWIQHKDVAWPVATRRRGRLLVGPDTVAQSDPLGVIDRILARLERQPMLVVPRVFAVTDRHAAALDAAAGSRRRPGDEEFHALREYVVGDERRRIHWRSSARMGTLLVRQDVTPHALLTMVLLDTDTASYPKPGSLFAEFDEEAFERAVDWTASLAIALAAPGTEAIVATTERHARPRPVTSARPEAILDHLALVQAAPGERSDVARAAAHVARLQPRRLVIVSGSPRRRWIALARHVPLVSHVHPDDPEGQSRPLPGRAA